MKLKVKEYTTVRIPFSLKQVLFLIMFRAYYFGVVNNKMCVSKFVVVPGTVYLLISEKSSYWKLKALLSWKFEYVMLKSYMRQLFTEKF